MQEDCNFVGQSRVPVDHVLITGDDDVTYLKKDRWRISFAHAQSAGALYYTIATHTCTYLLLECCLIFIMGLIIHYQFCNIIFGYALAHVT